jgi:Carboxypeptidase regulatory-like domain/TonB-dependent Receptor Plug Domain
MRLRLWSGIVLVVLGALVLPSAVLAQTNSQIAGTVKDESGGVLPGVTVEAASPVLIEKSLSAVSDSSGRYTIVNLRPGTYKVTFSLTGFSTIVRDGIELPANSTMTLNADLKVGALEETVTVSGQTPLVDVQQAARTQVITRDMIDSLPSTRNLQSVGNFVPGIRLLTPDIGGSRAMEQTSPRAHGLRTNNLVVTVDGMSIESNETNQSQTYYNDALNAEVSVTTSAQTAENSSGGILVNSVPKDGGNIVSGSVFLGGAGAVTCPVTSCTTAAAPNLSPYLKSQNVQSGNGTIHIQNFNGAIGGPIQRDKFWFFLATRHVSADELVANTPAALVVYNTNTGAPAPNGDFIRSLLDQYIRDVGLRLTYQINQKNKLGVFFQRTWKRKGKDFVFGTDPRAATQRDPRHAHLGPGQLKYTNTLTSKVLLEGGYSMSIQQFSTFNQPYNDQPRFLSDGVTFNPAWLAGAQKQDSALNINPACAYSFGCTQWVSNSSDSRTEARRMVFASSVSYVTGSHNIKFGFQDSFGKNHNYSDRQADLVEVYKNGLPNSVTVYTTPSASLTHVRYDLGIYVQDSWTIKRLTLNPGIRDENFNGIIEATTDPAGRFVPARYFPAVPNMPNWHNDLAPRFSVAYDLFGDGRTALKGGWGVYYQQQTGNFAQNYTTSAVSENRNWFDCDINAAGTGCSGVSLPTNGDGIAQLNEIGPSRNPGFGTRPDRNPDPHIQREYSEEATVSVSHQLFSRMSATVGYYHRNSYNISTTDRTNVSPADYVPFTVPMPAFTSPNLAGGADATLNGILDPSEVLTIYKISPAAAAVYGTGLVDRNVPDQSIYNGFDVSLQARLKGGSTVVGSWSTEKNVSVFCSNQNNPNGPTIADLYSATLAANGGRFCDQRKFHIPFQNEFKASGSYPFPHWGIETGVVLQSYAGTPRVITYTVPAGLFPGGQTNSEVLILNKPGSLFYPRFNQLDLNIKKNFRAGRKTFSLQLDAFNALNGAAVFTRNNTIGNSLGQVTAILQGRILRLGFQMRF